MGPDQKGNNSSQKQKNEWWDKDCNWQSKKRTKLEESGYSTKPEQVMHGIIRKEMKLTECV